MHKGKPLTRRGYLWAAALIFAIEVVIAIWVHDRIIRPFIGDLLVVILLYCLVRGISRLSVKAAAGWVLAFAFLVEILQYFDIVNLLQLGHNRLARVVIGTSFAWMDLWMYVLGIGLVLWLENRPVLFNRTDNF